MAPSKVPGREDPAPLAQEVMEEEGSGPSNHPMLTVGKRVVVVVVAAVEVSSSSQRLDKVRQVRGGGCRALLPVCHLARPTARSGCFSWFHGQATAEHI